MREVTKFSFRAEANPTWRKPAQNPHQRQYPCAGRWW